MLQQLIIRKGVIDDLAELQQLFVETVSHVCSEDYDSQQIRAWTSGIENKERWKEIMSDQFVLIAQFESKIVGFVTLASGNHIDLLYVHKDFQRQGIAYKLYTVLEEETIQQGQTELTSDVSKTARLFFESVGFKVVKEQTVIRQNVELTNYKMKKRLYKTISTKR